MEDNKRLIFECAMAGALHIRQQLALAGIEIPTDVKNEIVVACRASIETYIIERNRMIHRLNPMNN